MQAWKNSAAFKIKQNLQLKISSSAKHMHEPNSAAFNTFISSTSSINSLTNCYSENCHLKNRNIVYISMQTMQRFSVKDVIWSLRWLLLHLCFALFMKQNISGKKNWKSSCDWNIIHFFFAQVYMEISRGGFICAIAVTTKLTNQISLLDDEAKHKWLIFYFVLVNTKNILCHFCFVGMWKCADGANEAKYKWNITHCNLPNVFFFVEKIVFVNQGEMILVYVCMYSRSSVCVLLECFIFCETPRRCN